MTKMFDHSEISTMSDRDIHPSWGAPFFWDGIAAWMNKHLGTPWLNAQDMIDAGVRYSCAESGQHYFSINDSFVPYRNQEGVEIEMWAGDNRKVAKWNDEVVGIDVEIGRVWKQNPGEFQRLVKVMNSECINFFILFPKLSKSQIEENKQLAIKMKGDVQ